MRLQLSRDAVAWVNADEVVPLSAGTPPSGGVVGSVRLSPGPKSVILRVPLPARLPIQVTEHDRALTLRIYGGASDINWMQYGGTDPLVRRMSYAQPASDEVTITVDLTRRVWGYRARYDGRDLLLEIRRPPEIAPDHPLRGRTIVLDPGHPPLGATGPTGLWEPVATLAVALKAKRLLEGAGATVFLTRTDSTPLELYPRTHFAEMHDADVLVSIHANALPDGVNPFTNNGTSVYYFHPRSAPLARALDRALVAELGVRDLGMGRGDYALVRPTWMPAALTEGLFIMLPDQEAMLGSEDGQRRYARGLARGIENFLRERAHRAIEQRGANCKIGQVLHMIRSREGALYPGIGVRSQGGSPAFQSPSLSVTVFSPPCQRFSDAKGSEPRDRRGSERELSGGTSRVSGSHGDPKPHQGRIRSRGRILRGRSSWLPRRSLH